MVVKKRYEDIEDMINEAVDIDTECGTSFITKYDNAALILNELIGHEKFMPYFIELSDPAWDWYKKEFIITINNDGEIYCERFSRNDKYLSSEDDVYFVLPDCDDKCVEFVHNSENASVIVDVTFEDDEAEIDDKPADECDGCDGISHITIAPIGDAHFFASDGSIQLDLEITPDFLCDLLGCFN